jgi:hypothetical protein
MFDAFGLFIETLPSSTLLFLPLSQQLGQSIGKFDIHALPLLEERLYVIHETEEEITTFILGGHPHELDSLDECLDLHDVAEQSPHTINEARVVPVIEGRQSPISPHG